MIIAGIFGLSAVGCSTACAGLGVAAGAEQDPNAAACQAILGALAWMALLESICSIIVGAMVNAWSHDRNES